MISYFEHSKGRLTISEDSLTAMVFDQLKYLPSEVFWKIFKRAMYNDKLPKQSGDFKEILFWQKWDVKDNILNKNIRYVEPDIFLRYENFDIIIEAKRYNNYQQSDHQHNEQMSAYFYKYLEDNKNLYYIQMGGLINKLDVDDYTPPPLYIDGIEKKLNKVVILKTDWSSLLQSIVTEEITLRDSPYTHLTNYSRILRDLIKAFELFQFYSPKWLKDLKKRKEITENLKVTLNYV